MTHRKRGSMKLLTLLLLIALTLFAGACGVESTALDEDIGTVPSFTPAELEIYDYCETHIDDLDEMVTTLADLVEDEQWDPDRIVDEMGTIVAEYAQLNKSWMATNDGDLAGGKVRKLEKLWENCGDNARRCALTIIEIYTDPENVTDAESKKAGVALAQAVMGIDDIRVELDELGSLRP